MKPIYDMLGVSVGVIQSEMNPDAAAPDVRGDVTYGTNSEFGFDYLRDNMASSLEECVQREHAFAIVDEVDNILIDEARTPLIISGAPSRPPTPTTPSPASPSRWSACEMKTKLKSLGESRTPPRPSTTTSTTRSTRPSRRPSPGSTRPRSSSASTTSTSPSTATLVNHLIQSLKAESLYKRDNDYAVIDGEVKIIDEFTGRILEGRRWSEGLHQAVEAKEGVAIREENQTLATITLQNYFRLYDKLSGMTGTALTEATEFMKIYEIPVVEIPTNRPMVRADHNDQIYKTKEGKWKAVVDEIGERHERGQPILVGTISVEISEMISGELKRAGIEHVVLNAKPEHAEREGETIAQAGRMGAVTIATNMAGRGVDIKLGGDPEQLAIDELRKLGVTPGERELREELAEQTRAVQGADARPRARRCASSAACSSAAPSATSRAGSTTSCAAAPAARATRASRASSSPPRTT